jgi:tetratricopeptide (TPR) repeat protein
VEPLEGPASPATASLRQTGAGNGLHAEEIYLIQRPSCLVVERRTWRPDAHDSDIFSGMLDAVASFIDDSMRDETRQGVTRLERGSHLWLLYQGSHVSIAVLFSQDGIRMGERQAARIAHLMERSVRELELRFGPKFAVWNGAAGALRGTRREMDLLAVGISDVLDSGDDVIDAPAALSRPASGTMPWVVTRARLETATMLHRQGRRHEAALWLEGTEVPEGTPPHEKARLLHMLGSVYEAMDDTDRARSLHTECGRTGSSNAMALACLGIGRLEWRRGHYRKALDLLREARSQAVTSGELECQVSAMISEGSALARIYEEIEAKTVPETLEQAISVTKTALRVALGVGLARLRAFALMNLADYNRLLDRPDAMLSPAQEAIRAFQSLGEPGMVAQARSLIARAALAKGRKDIAARHALEMVSIPMQAVSADLVVRLHCAAADILRSCGELDQSRQALRTALDIAETNYLVTFCDQIRAELLRLSGPESEPIPEAG